jgi:hypothetical protein
MSAGKREVKVLITGDASKLARELGNLEGRMSRFSGVMRGALAGISVAAIGASINRAATEFQNMATAANDFATASGLSVEQASRWQEVAGDLGVEATTLQGALGRLSKGLGADEKKWEQYGVEVMRAADGTVDANKTFLRAIDVLHDIEDPLERAKLGSELFGRSWADLAPLVEMSADELQESLNEVGDAQVIDEAEVEKAKKFREAMDNLNDSTMGLKLTLIEALLPALTSTSTWIGTLDPQMVAWGVGIAGVIVVVGKLGTAISGVSSILSLFAAHPVFTATLAIIAAIALIVANWDKVTAAIQRAINKMDEFARKISGPITGILNRLPGVSIGQSDFRSNLGPAGLSYIEGRANGGGMRRNTPYLTGERGPELVIPRTDSTVIPNHALGGAAVTIHVHPAPGMDEVELARAVKREQDRAARGLGFAA